jgi:hypothetical protein
MEQSMDHSIYDKRKYPIVGVREGYAEWVRTYERTVQDEMDLHLLERLQVVDWSAPRCVLDLACGTGASARGSEPATPALLMGSISHPKWLMWHGTKVFTGRCGSQTF